MGNTCTTHDFQDAMKGDLSNMSFKAHIDHMNKHIPQTGSVKLLSYNIFMRPPGINNNGDDFKDERLEQFIEKLPSYDIVCLQEMFGAYSGRRSDLIERAKECGFLYHAVCTTPSTFSQHFIDGGLLILSRFPIVSSEFSPFPQGLGSDYYVLKGALYAQIQIGHSRLHLYTTHAQATYDNTLKYFMKRTEQFKSFKQFIDRSLLANAYKEGEAVILTGDFNVDGRDTHKFRTSKMLRFTEIQEMENLKSAEVFSEYDALVACLNGKDQATIENLLLKNKGTHAVTFGDFEIVGNTKKPKETVLTDKECLTVAECLDYIFKYVPSSLLQDNLNSPSSFVKESLTIIEESAEVEKFFVKSNHFTQLSDHYGVKIALRYSQSRFEEDSENASVSTDDDENIGSPMKAIQPY